MKVKKLKGGFTPFITEDEKLLVTLSRNTAYVYNLEDGKLLHTIKTLSNVSEAAISKDKQRLAVKNTSGTIALISLENEQEIFRSSMEMREGEAMTFTHNDQGVLDFDKDGRTMLLDCTSGEHHILEGPGRGAGKELPRTFYMHYDRYSDQIYKFIADEYGHSKGRVMCSGADEENIAFNAVREFTSSPTPWWGISFCRTHNYYADMIKKQLYVTDKNFTEVSRIAFPEQLEGDPVMEFWVSPGEKYMFVDLGKQCDSSGFEAYKTAKSLSYLFSIDTMELAAEFEYDYVSDFLMYDDDKKFVLATWKGSYLGII